LHAKEPSTAREARQFLVGAGVGRRETAFPLPSGRLTVRVIDSIGEDGAKLVEVAPDAALALRALQPGLRLVPVVHYTPAAGPAAQAERVQQQAPPPADPRTVTLRVVSQKDKSPVPGAFVVAYTDFSASMGVQAVTDAQGQAQLTLDAATVRFDRVYVYPVTAHWTLRKNNVAVKAQVEVRVQPLDLAYTDGLRHFYPKAADAAGKGVTVGVIDTGVAPHPDLVVAGGANTVPGESPADFGDNGLGHGTHLAGIIAARGRPPRGIRGVAPGVTLRSYRVYAQGARSATNFAIAKAVDQAATDGCDLLTLGMNGGPTDEVLRAAVEAVRAKGSVCIMGAGNGDRAPVTFPASDQMVIAVSALGRKGTFPTSAAEADDVAAPYGSDKSDFIAGFSNVGPEVDLTGPGVAIISTYPGGYAEISGTSMACAAVTGVAARVIAGPKVLGLPRDAARSDAIAKALLASAKTLGFQPPFEGHGLAKPPR
jgi:subtilisin